MSQHLSGGSDAIHNIIPVRIAGFRNDRTEEKEANQSVEEFFVGGWTVFKY
jgi:hypothetical protein